MIGKPKINDAETDMLVRQHFTAATEPVILLVGIRGYFLNTVGKPGVNDFNLYDDAMIVRHRGDNVATFNANTDPSQQKTGLAQLSTGIYTFYRGKHKGRIDAFRAYPEGVKLPCKRETAHGSWEGEAQYINIHDGGDYDTWSAGCQTLPGASSKKYGDQFAAFRDLVYRLMREAKQDKVTYLLIENN